MVLLATFFIYIELNAICVGLLENISSCIQFSNMLLSTLPCKTLYYIYFFIYLVMVGMATRANNNHINKAGIGC